MVPARFCVQFDPGAGTQKKQAERCEMKSMMVDGEEVVPLSDFAGSISWATRKQVGADGLEGLVLGDSTEGTICQAEGFAWTPWRECDHIFGRWFAAAQRHAVERDMGQKVRRVWRLVAYVDADPDEGEDGLSLVAYDREGHLGEPLDSEDEGDAQYLDRILPCDQWPGRANADPKLMELIARFREQKGWGARKGGGK